MMIEYVLLAVVTVPLLIGLTYVLARTASIGWYKTKREHFERIWKHTREDERNGH